MNELPNNQPCPHCGRYANRGLAVDAVIIRDGKVMLIQRGVEPFQGYWATPGGHLDWDETAEEGLRREVREETGLEVTSERLIGVKSSPSRHPLQVIGLFYLVEVDDVKTLKSGDDAVAFQWFGFNELPEVMAFDHKQNVLDAIKLSQR